MPNSCEYPDTIIIDVVKNGSARLLCRWDISEVEIKTDEDTHTEYTYQERVIWWQLPLAEYITRVNDRQIITNTGREYITENADGILDWAKAAAV
jgi:hypothetical protein